MAARFNLRFATIFFSKMYFTQPEEPSARLHFVEAVSKAKWATLN
jgi:hypothetical protein